MSPKKIKKRNHKQPKEHSGLQDHARKGKLLVPPWRKIENFRPSSWINERLPEMLWAGLLITHCPRDVAIDLFRKVARLIMEHRESERIQDVTHSGLSKVSPERLNEILELLTATDASKAALRPLLLLRHLPASVHWLNAIGEPPSPSDWHALSISVGKILFHQSQEATDCRWVRILAMLSAGILKIPSEETVKGILYYPEYGDMRKVRPSIRALEISFPVLSETWAEMFWSQCLADTPCWPLTSSQSKQDIQIATKPEIVSTVYRNLVQYALKTASTTTIDAKHDTTFGIALYCLVILQELLRIGASEQVSARLSLRTMVECMITLTYLRNKDQKVLWDSFRVFGAGQAKLTYLKLDEMTEPPKFLDINSIKELANEDMWEEFVEIDLGHWAKSNLRQLSEDSGVKAEYDKYYNWTSAFAHGHWGAVRDTIFDTCGNPLHRLHRVPRLIQPALPDVLPDACKVIDQILSIVDSLYPGFPHRVTADD